MKVIRKESIYSLSMLLVLHCLTIQKDWEFVAVETPNMKNEKPYLRPVTHQQRHQRDKALYPIFVNLGEKFNWKEMKS